MSLFILALIVAAVVCGVCWRRPGARAVVSGAWEAGKAQAVREFRDGYTYAQKRLRAGDPRWHNPRRWASWALATGYGVVKTIAAVNRIRRAAWRGGRDRYRTWRDTQTVPAEEVVEQIIVGPDTDQSATPDPGQHPSSAGESEQPAGDTAAGQPEPAPEPEAEPTQEVTEMQTEATGLTSYAAAHQQFASELRTQMSGSEALAASMSNILADHSDLIGDTAVLQDLLNQAAGVADRIAQRATAVANN